MTKERRMRSRMKAQGEEVARSGVEFSWQGIAWLVGKAEARVNRLGERVSSVCVSVRGV